MDVELKSRVVSSSNLNLKFLVPSAPSFSEAGPPEERNALSLIHFLRDQSQPQSEWLNALSSDQTISAPVRQRALQFARDWKP